MGLGAAMAGGNAADGRQEDDFYPTPAEGPEALLRAFSFGDRLIWEPMAGEMDMVVVIESFGYRVIASDLVLRSSQGIIQEDFLETKVARAPVIITNPPFKLAAQIIEHALGTLKVDALCLLLKSTFFHASSRIDLFKRYPPRVIAPLTWRLDFLGKGRPTMDCSWFIWTRGYNAAPSVRLLRRPEGSRSSLAIAK